MTPYNTFPPPQVNTGDNFYWCGIQNATDPQIHSDFELPYADPSLASLQWYSILGNHEYGYNSQAEIDYAMINDRWIMPSRYVPVSVPSRKVLCLHLLLHPSTSH